MEVVGVFYKNNCSGVGVEERMGGQDMKIVSIYNFFLEICFNEEEEYCFQGEIKKMLIVIIACFYVDGKDLEGRN